MPTGYTASIKDGISFEKFAIECSRAFGALISMRDDPLGTPIPEEFVPDKYYQNSYEESQEELAAFNAMNASDLNKLWEDEYVEKKDMIEGWNKDTQELLMRYNAMLEKVESWHPPTEDHKGLKNFMIDQIKQSISFDCDIREMPIQEPFEIWHQNKLNHLKEEVARRAKSYNDEIERCAGRNKWLKDLRDSLAKQQPV